MWTALVLAASLGAQPAALENLPAEEGILALNEGMKRFLESKIDLNDPPRARLESLVSAVFHESTLGFTYQEGQTRTAAETFAQRGGNCLSFTTMFIALARQAGLDARFHEVDIAPVWSKRGKVVVVGRHINVVAYVDGVPFEVDLVPSLSRIRVGRRTVPDRRGFAHYYSNKGVDLLSQGSLLPALRHFEMATQSDPAASFAWGNLAVVQAKLGRDLAAESSYLRAIKASRGNLAAIHNLALFYQSSGREGKARKYWKKAKKFRNKNPYHHFNLGEEAFRSGNFNEAVKHYKSALRRKSEEHLFHFALAKAYAQLGEVEQVRKSLRKAHKHARETAWAERYSRKLQLLTARANRSTNSSP
ncbi:MAG: tetratricopeptide repeat protein [Acidobacteriota bacterium]